MTYIEIANSGFVAQLNHNPLLIYGRFFGRRESEVLTMHNYKDLKPEERFSIVNQVLGYGKPTAPVWFIGLEESGIWKENPNEDREYYDRCKRCVDGWVPMRNGDIEKQEKQAKQDGIKYTTIYEIMSKLLLQITRNDFSGTELKTYQNTRLVVDASHCNLYPLAKPRRKKWPGHYKRLFGFGEKKSDQECYEREADCRLQRIITERRKANPRITVCFGAEQWYRFKKLVTPGKAPELFDRCELYPSGIVLTPFFTYEWGHMTEDRIKNLAERLRHFWSRGAFPSNPL